MADIKGKTQPNGDGIITHCSDNGCSFFWEHWGIGARTVRVPYRYLEEFEEAAKREDVVIEWTTEN